MNQKIHRRILRRVLSVTGVVAMLLSLILPPAAVHSAELGKKSVQTDTVTFDAATDKQLFNLYSSSMGSFAVKNGMLTPTGTSGEFKAIYKDEDAHYQSVSVELHPGTEGINGGLYINASDPAHGREKITGLGVMVQSNHTGWEDAPNRIDLVICAFPGWTELQRTISETGAGNALFTGGVKEALNLKVDISGNQMTVTLSLLSDASKFITTTYTHSAEEDLGLGDVGIRSDACNGTFDNFTMVTTAAESEEPEVTGTVDMVDFETPETGDKFDFYHSSTGGFAVQDGKLIPTGAEGEFKAIYKDTNVSFQSVSVDIYPGEDGINGGIYLDVTQAGHPENQITGLVVMVESNMSGWSDAVNRADLVVGEFPVWTELHRTISETGNGNALFTGEKAPVNLKVTINGNQLTATISRLDDPTRSVSATCTCEGYTDIALGNVGLRSQRNTASFDNFSVVYTTVDADKEPDVVIPEPVPPTDLVDFEALESGEKFDFYHSSTGGFAVQDGKLVPTGEAGEFKAIYKDTNASFQSVSVDIYPGEEGINGGIYLDVTQAGHPENQITGLVVMAEANFAGWEDAVNRADLVIGSFPQWTELHRVISETGNGNALFAGQRVPLNLTVGIEGNTLTVTLKRLDAPERFVTTTYVCDGYEDIALGNVGIRSQFNTASYDNFSVVYTTVDEDKEPDYVEPEKEPTDLVDFEGQDCGEKFDFYHSSNGGFVIEDGKLVPAGEEGEFKAIYRDGGATISGVSVDLYPSEGGVINSGIYIGTSTVEDGADRIRGLCVMVESNMTGWDDAVNRIDIVVGRFPIWKELHRYTSETGSGNALYAGAKEPINLQIELEGNKMTVTVRLVNDPDRYVTTVYEYQGATPLPRHNVGIRSAYNDVCFDNFAVYSEEGGGSQDPN